MASVNVSVYITARVQGSYILIVNAYSVSVNSVVPKFSATVKVRVAFRLYVATATFNSVEV